MAAGEERQDNIISLPPSLAEDGQSPSGDAHTRDRLRWLDQVMADRELTLLAFHVAYVIASHVNRETGEAWPSQARIADRLRSTDRGVRKTIDQLEARGHITVTTPTGRKGGNRYRLNLKQEKAEVIAIHRNGGSDKGQVHRHHGAGKDTVHRNGGSGEVEVHRNGGSGLTGTVVPPNPLNEPSEKETLVDAHASTRKSRRTKVKPDGSGFAEAYELYPRHVAPDAARRAYDKAIRDGARPEVILAGVRRYAAERAGEPQRYTAHMATWLNDGRWKDGRPPSSGAPTTAPAEVFEVRGRQVPEENIVAAIGRWRRAEGWPSAWGPAPDDPACRIPRPILDRAGAGPPPPPRPTAHHQRQEGARS